MPFLLTIERLFFKILGTSVWANRAIIFRARIVSPICRAIWAWGERFLPILTVDCCVLIAAGDIV
jgi:hypothetical protein